MDISQTSQLISVPEASSKSTGYTVTIIILIIILIVVIIIIVLFFTVFNRTETTTTTSTCTFNSDCPAGHICSDGVCRSLECPLPPAPTNIQLNTPISGTIIVSWDSVPGATSYRAYLGINPNFSKFNAIDYATTQGTNIQFTDVLSGFNYFIFVTAVNECGEGPKSQEPNIFVIYIWPDRFTINSGAPVYDESWKAGLARDYNYPTTKEIDINYECNSVICPCPAGCEFTYDDNLLEIRSFDDDTLCMVVVEDEIDPILYDPKIILDTCGDHIAADKQWVFIEGAKNICLANNVGKCIEDTFGNPIRMRLTDFSPQPDSINRRKWEPVASFG